ncbi:septum formation initiator family protein [Agromyces sp. ZXT2-6]|uniref:septum formation initiator family protein n=1 Tax=Agromyces sp. ZXT2-6 TaxID=3461153 RepID=UPI0040552A42
MNAARRPTPPKGKAPAAGKTGSAKGTGAKADAAKSARTKAPAKPGTKAASKPPTAKPGSSRPARPIAKAGGAGTAGTRQSIRQVSSDWLAGIRFSGFSIIMMGVLVLAVVVLAPSIAAYAEQRQQIAELKAEVALQEAEVARLTEQRERWNDETYIVTQARERLYYVLPGEVSYLVIDDRSPEALANADRTVSREVTEQRGDWMQTMLRSVMTAGLAPAPSDAPAEPAPADPAPSEPTSTGTDQPADEGTR